MIKKVTKRRVGRYSLEVKEQAAIEYAICGSLRQVSKNMGINENTVQDWKKNGSMDATIARVHDQKQEQLRAKYIKGCELAIDHTLTKLPEATAAQSAVISGVFFDKVRLIDNQPTAIRSDSSSMLELAKQFQAIARDHKNIQSSVISVQDKDNQ